MDARPLNLEPQSLISEASPTDSLTAARLVFQTSTIHGTGGFASGDIPAGTRIIQYRGEKISKAESVRRCELNNEYIFSFDEDYDLDGSVEWNPARFINHSCAPNCEAQFIDGQIWIVAIRAISAREELTFNYGYDFEDFESHPCRCGAADCIGFILAEEYFEEARRRVELAAWSSRIS
jgi:SET domain-containing protein